MSMVGMFSEFEVATLRELTGFEHSLATRLAGLSTDLANEMVRSQRAWSERLNQTARRLRLAETEGEWRAILIETACRICEKVDVFLTSDPDIAGAPAFATVIETKDTVVTLRDASQLSESVIGLLGDAVSPRCHLFPILGDDSVAAVLYAEHSSSVDRHALELLATIASGTVPSQPNQESPAQAVPQLIQIAGLQPLAGASLKEPAPPIPDSDRPIHLAAQRFARVTVAKMMLDHHNAIKSGRLNRTLYVTLKEPIDSGRRSFHRDYVDKCPSMADYYHEELVRTLAQHDESKMGNEYTGAEV